MSEPARRTGISAWAVLSLVLGFVTIPALFFCAGYATGALGIALGGVGFFRSTSWADRVATGLGVALNGCAMAGYTLLVLVVMATTPPPAPPVADYEGVPVSEREFCEALDAARAAYERADDGPKKAKARADRGKVLRAVVPLGRVSKWTGKVAVLATTAQGNLFLEITLPCSSFSVGTWNGEFSDARDHTLVPPSSSAYETLSKLRVGGDVTFDGTLVPDVANGFEGMSITESGSMSGELFLMRF